MTRTLTASVLALSLALSSIVATPARAISSDDFNRILAGAIALAILGKALDIDLAPKERIRPPAPKPPRNWRPTPTPPSNWRPAPNPPHESRTAIFRGWLPGQCYFKAGRGQDRRPVYGKRCLRENMRQAVRLPKVCEETVRIRNGRQARVFDAKCLSGWGYRRARF